MAKGITETQVHETADALVAAGERPTVERIRAALGTGSPNTVVRHLDSWWQGLGSRLHVAGERTALPMVPQDLTQLANQWWETALIAARGAALHALAQEHAALAQARQQFEDEVQAQAGQVRDAYATAANATHALELAQTQVHDGKRLAQQQASQLADLARQRDALQSRLEQVEQGSVALTQQLEQQARDAAQERERQGVYVQAVEDRANAEIDRARQELREVRTQHSTAHRQQSALENQLRGERDKALEQAALMHRELAVVRGQAENLEKQVQTLGNLPQVLQAALSSARTKPRGKATSARPRAAAQKSTT